MPRMLIIADDLSGAADCAMGCAAAGLTTVVTLADFSSEINADVVAVDAATRSMSSAAAAAKVARVLESGSRPGQLLFKKIDSTLRGNIGAEIRALLELQRKRHLQKAPVVAVLAPAFPAHGRTTAKGWQLLNGRRLEELAIWKREGKQGTSCIPNIMNDAGLQSRVLDKPTLWPNHAAFKQALIAHAEHTDVLICDAETDADLLTIAQAGMELGPATLWAGSAGLAYQLPKAAKLTSFKALPSVALAAGPTLFAVGSPSYKSQEQARYLQSSTVSLVAPPRPWSALSTFDAEQYQTAIRDALTGGKDVLVALSAERDIPTGTRGEYSRMLANLVAPFAHDVGALVATGGETARAILDAWGIRSLRLVQEVEAGVPFSLAEHGNRNLPILTKAGDFGNAETLLRCQLFLRSLDRNVAQSFMGKNEP